MDHGRVRTPALSGTLACVPLNLFLLNQADSTVEWSVDDPRAIHLKKILQAKDGDRIDFGVVNGPRGKGLVTWTNSGTVQISLQWSSPHPSDLLPISLLIGLSRPQTCRKIIEQSAALGVSELIFFHAKKGELSYGKSSLWEAEWQRLLVKGAEQAFSCHLPWTIKVDSLEEALSSSRFKSSLRLALDIYEATGALSSVKRLDEHGAQLAIGPERGWSQSERVYLRQQGFEFCHMGQRVLRVETAMVAAVGYLSANYWSGRGWGEE